MNLAEILAAVPVKGRIIRIIDIPNPWRSEFLHDSYGSTMPVVPGEGLCSYSYDWRTWLSFRLAPDYRPRYPGAIRLVSDEEAMRPPFGEKTPPAE